MRVGEEKTQKQEKSGSEAALQVKALTTGPDNLSLMSTECPKTPALSPWADRRTDKESLVTQSAAPTPPPAHT